MTITEENLPLDSNFDYAVQMFGIVKEFPGILANDHIDFEVKRGEIHALLGENGAGKTTLMNILYALYSANKGDIFINGNITFMKNPYHAMKNGIGMVHQHFMLVPVMTVAENIVLGSEPKSLGICLNQQQMRSKVLEISQQFELHVNPDEYIENMPVGLQQRVEILKILYREANILILDEPTAVLTPQEVKALFKTLKSLKKQGKTIIIITHKLKECLALSDRITVLKGGRLVGTVNTTETNAEELAYMMVGHRIVESKKETLTAGYTLLKINDLKVLNESGILAVNNINLELHASEILGIAGVVGNGQKELAESICGLRRIESGNIEIVDRNDYLHTYSKISPRTLSNMGLSYIPEDRQKTGTVAEFSIAENLILGIQHNKRFYHKKNYLSRMFIDWGTIKRNAKKLIDKFDIRTPSSSTKIRYLSGGNQQKVIVARELSKDPKIVIAVQPTRGLDVGVIDYVHNQLLELRKAGKAILLISSELDEILTLSDRIAVIYEGEIIGYQDPKITTEKRLGLLMAGQRDLGGN